MRTTRRQFMQLLGAGVAAGMRVGQAAAAAPGERMRTRPIPGAGEELPVLGMGTWQTFDVGRSPEERSPLAQVLEIFFDAGGRVIDSSPMYGAAEAVTGDLLADLDPLAQPFLATKVWTTGREAGIRQMDASLAKLRAARIDLLQVHNLVDWRTHLATLRAWKEAGRVRYIGVTDYRASSFDDLERIFATEAIDFVQLPYSLAEREAERRLLPAAAEHAIAVLVMQPFASGALFGQARGRALPPWAADFDCASWAQFFLKFVLGHPTVTCPLPATSNPEHMRDNVRAGFGRLPDEPTRRRMPAVLGL